MLQTLLRAARTYHHNVIIPGSQPLATRHHTHRLLHRQNLTKHHYYYRFGRSPPLLFPPPPLPKPLPPFSRDENAFLPLPRPPPLPLLPLPPRPLPSLLFPLPLLPHPLFLWVPPETVEDPVAPFHFPVIPPPLLLLWIFPVLFEDEESPQEGEGEEDFFVGEE